jgi:hypothetical protein
MQTPETAKPPLDLGEEAVPNSELLLGGQLGILGTPNTAIIQDVLSEMVGGVDITDLWDALMGDTP